MSTGTIRQLVRERGFGFIASNGGDIFFHHSQLQGADFRMLREGQSVKYRIVLGTKGFRAMDVKPSDKSLHSVISL